MKLGVTLLTHMNFKLVNSSPLVLERSAQRMGVRMILNFLTTIGTRRNSKLFGRKVDLTQPLNAQTLELCKL